MVAASKASLVSRNTAMSDVGTLHLGKDSRPLSSEEFSRSTTADYLVLFG
jgi:hypothetical protein